MSKTQTLSLNETLKKLLLLLSDGEFHSGEHLGKFLGLTRSAIWKLIKQLSTWDLNIESVTNKGYRINGGLSLLNLEQIQHFLSSDTASSIPNIEVWDSLPSTNDYLLSIERNTKPKTNIACFAERQTAGRGRRGRGWISPFAQNIYLSILWHFPQDLCALSGLSLAVGISIVETLQALGITKPLGVKWPNDVYSEHQKLCGILIELSGEANDTSSIVIGIGLNVFMSSKTSLAHESISDPWTDVQSVLTSSKNFASPLDIAKKTEKPLVKQELIDRNELAGKLLQNLSKTLLRFGSEGFAPFKEKWEALDVSFGQAVAIVTSTETYHGIGRGINSTGHFLLELENGQIKNFSSGEVSLRLMMPYLPVQLMHL